MPRNDDRISKPKTGRFFGLTLPEMLKLVRELEFQHSEYQIRIDVAMMNLEQECQFGILLASFCPGYYLALFSLPDDITPERAKSLDKVAVREFAVIDKQHTKWSRQRTVSYRAYLVSLKKIVITQRNYSFKLQKYRSVEKFASAKPKGVHVDEKVIREIMA